MIYAIRNDGFRFQELALQIDDFIELLPEAITDQEAYSFSRENLKLAQWWRPLETRFVPIEGTAPSPVPDLSSWIGATLVLSPKAYDAIGTQLEPWGELLPILVDGQTFRIFNCNTVAKVDESRCERQMTEGVNMGLKALAFDEADTANKLAFKTPEQGSLDLFCSEELKQLIEQHGLQGIVFDPNLVLNFE